MDELGLFSQFVSRFGMRDVLTEGMERELGKRQNKQWERDILLKVCIRRAMPQ